MNVKKTKSSKNFVLKITMSMTPSPWVMGLYNVVQWLTPSMGDGVVQRLTLSMGDGVVQCCTMTHPLHGSWGCTTLYNCLWAPWVMRPMITLEKYIID